MESIHKSWKVQGTRYKVPGTETLSKINSQGGAQYL